MSAPIAVLQREVIDRLAQPRWAQPSEAHALLHNICDFEDEAVQIAFGKLGYKLRAFKSEVSMAHPAIGDVFGGYFSKNSPAAEGMMELYQLAKYARSFGHIKKTTLYPLLLKIFPRKYYKEIDAPSQNLLNIRYVRGRKNRESLRQKLPVIGLNLKTAKISAAWNSHPDTFQMFLRFSEDYRAEVDKANALSERYMRLGVKVMSQMVDRSINQFVESIIVKNYYGYIRCSLLSASIILAKSLGFRLDENEITAPQAYVPHAKKYSPRAYSLHEVVHLAPKNVVSIIESIEDEFGMFDNYRVLVPSVGDSAELDFKYMADNTYMPIVLGEANNCCYFLCYWI